MISFKVFSSTTILEGYDSDGKKLNDEILPFPSDGKNVTAALAKYALNPTFAPATYDDIVGRIDRIDCKKALFRIEIFDKVFNSYRLGPSLIAALGNRSKIFGYVAVGTSGSYSL